VCVGPTPVPICLTVTTHYCELNSRILVHIFDSCISQTHSIPEDGRPDALSELITSRSALVPDDLSNLHEQMHTWLMRLQPASRRPQKGFRKMKLAKDVDPIEFDSLRCTTSRGLVLVMTGLSWLYKSNCPHFPNIPSRSDLVNEMTAILKVMRKL